MKPLLLRCFSNPILVSILTFALLCLNGITNLPKTQLLLVITGAWLLLLILSEPLRIRIKERLGRFLTPRSTVLFCTLFLIFMFQLRLPFSDWNKIILEDDYTPGFVANVKSLEALREGGLFGWDGRIMGGYPQVTEATMNKSMFMWPFVLAFGPKIGHHAFIFCAFLLFPFLCLLYARTRFRDPVTESAVFAFASVLVLSFFRNFLAFGMIDALLGLDFFVANLILFDKTREGTRWAPFVLSLTVACAMYSHIGLFFISLLFLAIELFTHFSRRLFLITSAVLFFSFFMTLHNTFYFLVYREYFPTEAEFGVKAATVMSDQLKKNLGYLLGILNPLKALTIRFSLDHLILAFAPILAYMFLKGNGRIRPIALYLVLIPVVKGIEFPSTMVVTFRIVFVAGFFLAVLLGSYLRSELSSNRLHNALLIPFMLLPTIGTHTWHAMRHTESLEKTYPEMVGAIKAMDGHSILLENVAHLNPMVDKERYRSEWPPPELTHWENLLSLELPDKRFLANSTETYHFYKYRDVYINSGVFKGQPIENFAVSEINAHMRKWGVKYLVVWSQRSKSYFARARDDYQSVLQSGHWQVFRFLTADPRSVAMPSGSGHYDDIGRFGKKLYLTGAVRGDTAVIRETYFPNWRAFHRGSELAVVNANGQMGVLLPADGDLEIDLRFPKYHLFSALALGSIVLSFLFFWRPGIPGRIRGF